MNKIIKNKIPKILSSVDYSIVRDDHRTAIIIVIIYLDAYNRRKLDKFKINHNPTRIKLFENNLTLSRLFNDEKVSFDVIVIL